MTSPSPLVVETTVPLGVEGPIITVNIFSQNQNKQHYSWYNTPGATGVF